ncbi:hypothetical protein GGR56DRAFT_187302 [Xylariaceae sp. FL0804]|nr:hypothetical protein GGR56DRAFT_187302 [Xylariaceae sp. FL0804]
MGHFSLSVDADYYEYSLISTYLWWALVVFVSLLFFSADDLAGHHVERYRVVSRSQQWAVDRGAADPPRRAAPHRKHHGYEEDKRACSGRRESSGIQRARSAETAEQPLSCHRWTLHRNNPGPPGVPVARRERACDDDDGWRGCGRTNNLLHNPQVDTTGSQAAGQGGDARECQRQQRKGKKQSGLR